MKRQLIIGMVVALVLSVAIGAGFARGDGEGRPDRGRGDGQRREKRDIDPAERAKIQERRMLMSAAHVLRVAAELPEAEAARKAYLQEVQPVLEEMKNLHQQMRKDMRDARETGATEEEMKALLKQGQAAVAEAQKKLIPAQIGFCKALLAIAEQHPDKIAAQIAKNHAKRMRNRGRERKQHQRRQGNQHPEHDQPAPVE